MSRHAERAQDKYIASEAEPLWILSAVGNGASLVTRRSRVPPTYRPRASSTGLSDCPRSDAV